MFKKKTLLPVLYIGFLSSSFLHIGLAQAEIKTLVDAHLLVHGNMLGGVADNVPTSRVQLGMSAVLQDNLALKHAREVAQLINDGGEGARLMTECCWRPQPAVYSNFIVSGMQDILSTAAPTPPAVAEDLYNPDDPPNSFTDDEGRPTFPIPPTYGDHMASVFDQMVRIRAGYAPNLPSPADNMDQFTYDWITTLTAGIPNNFNFTDGTLLPADSLASRLVWNWSYEGKKYRQFRQGEADYTEHPQAFLDNFRDYYNWACVVCLGAGFYDTTGMYDIDANVVYRANDYYYAIVALLSSEQQTWLSQQYDEGFKGATDAESAPRLQLSLGLTIQSQQNNNPETIDSESTYGTHCHTAAEFYVPVDPMGLDKKLGGGVLDNQEGSNYNTNSYMAGLPNASGANPTFGPFDVMQAQVNTNLLGSYTELLNGDIAFWDKRVKHSMHTGQRFQFAVWARVDRPWEGTFFPEDIDALQNEGGDGTIDSQDQQPYATACIDQAVMPGAIIPGKKKKNMKKEGKYKK